MSSAVIEILHKSLKLVTSLSSSPSSSSSSSLISIPALLATRLLGSRSIRNNNSHQQQRVYHNITSCNTTTKTTSAVDYTTLQRNNIMLSRNITTSKKDEQDESPDWVIGSDGGGGGNNNKSDKHHIVVLSSAAATPESQVSTATAAAATVVVVAEEGRYELITEGQITMAYPKQENSVFYNPVQIQNRDLSILMLGLYAERRKLRLVTCSKRKEIRKIMLSLQEHEQQQQQQKEKKKEENKLTKESRKIQMAKFESELTARVTEAMSTIDIISTLQNPNTTTTTNVDTVGDNDDDDDDDDGLTILEALAASGLRSLRYWTEIPGVRSIVINDLDPVAIDMARTNMIRNNLLHDIVHDTDDDKKKDETTGLLRRRRRPRGIQLQVGDATHEMYMSRLSPRLRIDQFNITQHYQKPQYDIIDLDPYGSAAPYMDGAIQAVVHGGLLAITCTDMAALGGSHPETCYGRYGAFPIQRVGYLQELALRLLLYHVSIVAARYGRTIKPILSVGMAFYCRIFVEVYDDKAGVNNLSLCHGHLYQSSKCSSYHVLPVATNDYVQCNNNNGDGGGDNDNNSSRTNSSSKKKKSNVYRNGRGPCNIGEPTCGETDGSYKIAGPLWIGPLHDMDVVTDAIHRLEVASQAEYGGVSPTGGTPMFPLHTATTIHGLLVSVSEELPDVPLYHLLPTLCSTVNSSTIPMTTFKAALVNAGYRVSAYHKDPSAIKTDAPNYVVWDVIRAWCKEHPPHTKKESRKHGLGKEQVGDDDAHASTMTTNEEGGGGGSVDIATRILSNESRTTIDFTIPEGLEYRKKARRWAQNPTANWGPKKAASGKNKRNNDTMMQEEKDDIINDDTVSEKKSKLK